MVSLLFFYNVGGRSLSYLGLSPKDGHTLTNIRVPRWVIFDTKMSRVLRTGS